MIDRPKIGEVYQHKKGGLYRVIDFVRHTETEDILVVYIPIKDQFSAELGLSWARPINMFCDGRFEKV